MNLKDYLEKCNLSVRDFAKICNLSTTVLYKMLKGERVSKRSIHKIRKKTNGEIDYQNEDCN